MKKSSSIGLKNLSLIAALSFILLMPSIGLAKASKIAVLPWKVNSAGDMDFVRNAMADMLTSRLGAADTELIRPDIVKGAVNEKAEVTDISALETGKKLKADYVLYGSLTVFGSAVSLDAKLLTVENGSVKPFASKATGLDSVIGLTDKLSADVVAALNPAKALNVAENPEPVIPSGAVVVPVLPVVPVQEQQATEGFIIKPKENTQRPVVWKSKHMDGMYNAMTAVDLDKDGSKELVLVSDKGVTIAAYKAEGLQVIRELNEPGFQNISVAAIDTDKDGVIEVYISRIADNKPSSAILEYRDNAYKITATGIGFLLRTVQVGDSEPTLIGQRFRKIDGFYGDLKVLRKDGNRLVEKGTFEIALPKKMDIYRFEAFNLTDSGGLDIVSLDDREYLKVFTKGDGGAWKADYKSKDYYGGTLNYINLTEDRPGAEPALVPVEGRFFHADMDKDGKREIIVKKNTPAGLGRSAERPASFKTGEIISLSWDKDGETTAENWRTKQVEGYIADFFIDDLDGDGKKEITMLVVSGTENLFGSVKSYVLSHKMSL